MKHCSTRLCEGSFARSSANAATTSAGTPRWLRNPASKGFGWLIPCILDRSEYPVKSWMKTQTCWGVSIVALGNSGNSSPTASNPDPRRAAGPSMTRVDSGAQSTRCANFEFAHDTRSPGSSATRISSPPPPAGARTRTVSPDTAR